MRIPADWRWAVTAVSFFLSIGAVLWALTATLPHFSDVRYQWVGSPQEIPASLPLLIHNGQQGDYTVRFTMSLTGLHPTSFSISPDDCLEALTVNGRAVTDVQVPFCDFANVHTLDLAHALGVGPNTVELQIHNAGGDTGLRFAPVITDRSMLVIGLLILLSLWLGVRTIGSLLAPHDLPVQMLLFLGTALRVFYTLVTPHDVRSHDWGGHYDYVQYLLTHIQLPNPADGWEFYQAPLYYMVSALFLRVAPWLGLGMLAPQLQLQILATLCSIVAFVCCFLVARQLFGEKAQRPLFLSLIALFATFPGIIMFASRINNDVLAFTLGAAWCSAFVAFAASGNMRTWILACTLAGLGILTKTNMVLPAVTMGIWMLCMPRLRWKRKAALTGIFLAIVVVITGWYAIPRTMQMGSSDRLVVGNNGNLNGALRVDASPSTYVTFNPVEILRHPYNNAWSDSERRQEFWEYFYRSAFFGEFDFGVERHMAAMLLLGTGFLLLPLALLGMGVELRRRTLTVGLPLTLLTLLLLIGHTILRFRMPYSSIEDFRYSILLTIPLFAFAIRGGASLPSWGKIVGLHILSICGFLWTVWILSLAW